MRNVGGVIAGIVAGLIVMMLVSFLGGLIFPVQGEVDLNDPESITSMFATSPTGAKIVILLSWFSAAFAGGAVAKMITHRNWAAWTVAGLVTVMALLNVLVLPMPVWMQITAIIAPLLGGWLAGHVGPRDRVVTTDGEGTREEV